MRKKIFLTSLLSIVIFTIVSIINANAQGNTREEPPNLVLPQFAQATVKLKTGQSYSAVMNYEKIEQEMIILRNERLFLFKDKQAVDTIIINSRTFVPAGTGFYEVLVNAPVSLFIQHKGNLESLGSTVAYGTKSNTAGVTHITTIYGQEGAIVLQIPENYKVVDASVMWINKDDNMTKVLNKKQFLALFTDVKRDLDLYIKKNHTNFGEADDVTRLVLFCNELYK
jgi:hypothetical protein